MQQSNVRTMRLMAVGGAVAVVALAGVLFWVVRHPRPAGATDKPVTAAGPVPGDRRAEPWAILVNEYYTNDLYVVEVLCPGRPPEVVIRTDPVTRARSVTLARTDGAFDPAPALEHLARREFVLAGCDRVVDLPASATGEPEVSRCDGVLTLRFRLPEGVRKRIGTPARGSN